MLTGKRFWTLALVLGLCVLATAGCRRKKSNDTTINGFSIFTTDSFPGAPVQAGNVADDQRGFSEGGIDVSNTGDISVYFNGDRDIAMVAYTTGSGNSFSGGGGAQSWIHYYDGVFRPGVPLQTAVDLTDPGRGDGFFGGGDTFTHDITVAWINTEGHTSSAAQARNGDAIIHWMGMDFASGGTDGDNCALFSTYFRSEFADDEYHTTAAGTEYRRGFDRFGFRVDVESENSEDVRVHGLISDGLCGEARWATYGAEYRWGHETTHIVVFWNQFVNNTSAFDPTTLWARYPLDTATAAEDPIIPTLPLEISILTFGASDTGIDSHETQIDTEYISYNFTIFQRVASDDSATPDFGVGNDDDDVTIQSATFNTGGTDFFSSVTIHTSLPDSTDTVENDAQFINQNGDFLGGHSTYGPDEGILEIVQFHTQLEAEPTGSYAGTATNSGDLVISQINPTTGANIGTAYLDGEQGLITSDDVESEEVDMQMSRNGDYLMIAWLEILDTPVTDDLALWAAHYRTSRDEVVGIAAIGTVTTFSVNVNVDIDGDPVNWFSFQEQLGYVCGLQSDAEVMNLFFEQSDGGYDEVDMVRLTADLLGAGAVFTVGPDSVVTSDDDDGMLSGGDTVGFGGNRFAAIDSGEGGNYFCSFDRDIDTAGFTDEQVHAIRTGTGAGSGRIDSNLNFRTSAFDFLIGTPQGSEIGVFGTDSDEARSAPAEIINVFFGEDEFSETLGSDTFTIRTRAFYTESDSGIIFADAFTPNLVDYPFQLALAQSDDSQFGDPFIVDVAVEGNMLCLIFEQLGHLYYQQFDGGSSSDNEISWMLTEGGDGSTTDDDYTAPALVDDDANEEIEFSDGWWTRHCVCDNCHGAMVFWQKDLDAGVGDSRWQVRVLEGGNN